MAAPSYLQHVPVDNRSSWIFHHFLPVLKFQPWSTQTGQFSGPSNNLFKNYQFCLQFVCLFVCLFTFAIVAKLYPTNRIRAANAIVVSNNQFQAHTLNNTGTVRQSPVNQTHGHQELRNEALPLATISANERRGNSRPTSCFDLP